MRHIPSARRRQGVKRVKKWGDRSVVLFHSALDDVVRATDLDSSNAGDVVKGLLCR